MKNELEKVKEDFAKRLNLAMDKANYPSRGRARLLSKQFGVSDKGAGKWINGEAIPETSKIPLIAVFLGVNTEWLLSGHGDIHPDQSQRMGGMAQSQGTSSSSIRSHSLEKIIQSLEKLESAKKLSPEVINTLESVINMARSTHNAKSKTIDYPNLFKEQDKNDGNSTA